MTKFGNKLNLDIFFDNFIKKIVWLKIASQEQGLQVITTM